MKSKYLLIALLALSGAASAHAEKLSTAPKDAKSAIISTTTASTTASSTAKSKKIQDPIIVLMDTLASSIDKVSLQIDNLQKQGADTGKAEGLIFDAKLQLHTVSLMLSATTTASTTATSTAAEIKKAKDEVRKKAVDQLKVVYADTLNAIAELKKTILAQQQILDGSAEIADAGDTATTTVATSSIPTATTTLANQVETQ